MRKPSLGWKTTMAPGVDVINCYQQVKISAPASVAVAFREACTAKNVSMASVLSGFMADYSNTAMIRDKHPPDYATKRQRRAAINSIVKQLEQIKTAEEQYRDNIPENLQGSVVFDNAEQCVSWIEEAIDLLIAF